MSPTVGFEVVHCTAHVVIVQFKFQRLIDLFVFPRSLRCT